MSRLGAASKQATPIGDYEIVFEVNIETAEAFGDSY
jgi:hypothetical protein